MSMTGKEINELEQMAREAARQLQEAGYTYERAVEDVTAYIHRLRARQERQRTGRSR